VEIAVSFVSWVLMSGRRLPKDRLLLWVSTVSAVPVGTVNVSDEGAGLFGLSVDVRWIGVPAAGLIGVVMVRGPFWFR
jgi:hypothetical protein